MKDWLDCKKILCIRADNMGDVLMSSLAIRAVKETFQCKLALLTSSKGEEIAYLIPEIDQVICFDFPWVQTTNLLKGEKILSLVKKLKEQNFDGCIIFSVYSQNPLPSAMLAYLAEIPLRLAYCRENPYGLLSHWIPDKEPYAFILHQVERDLRLVETINAIPSNHKIFLEINPPKQEVEEKIKKVVGYLPNSYFILHPGVSEDKRKYPMEKWVELGQSMLKEIGIPLIITGSKDEELLVQEIVSKIGAGAFSFAGKLSVEELAFVIKEAKAVISVNTGTVHIAAAMQTPVLVLYAQSNPQHQPWMVAHECLEFSIPYEQRSRNEVIRFVNETRYKDWISLPTDSMVVETLKKLLNRR